MNKEKFNLDIIDAYLKGVLNAKERAEIEEAISRDVELAATVALIREMHDARQSTKSAASGLSKKLFKDFIKSRKNPGQKRGVIVYDSKELPLPEGIRPAVVDTRMLRYKFENYDLELSLYPLTPDAYEIIGQITGLEITPVITAMLTDRNGEYLEKADEYGIFRFARIPVGNYKMNLHKGRKRLGAIELSL